MTPVDVLVAVPAHDEAATVEGCLDAVATALERARTAGVVDRARVAVVAHRCSDDTLARARQVLAARPTVEAVLLAEEAELRVGEVRHRLIGTAVAHPPALASTCWVLSTDADTVVPPDWVTGLLEAARTAGAELVLGLAELDDWQAGPEARQAYRRLIEAGLRGDQHTHVYAANLAVSWSAYRAAGGFPAAEHGEEHALVAAVRALGRATVSPLTPRVRTSARMPGRATAGLGDLLDRLARR